MDARRPPPHMGPLPPPPTSTAMDVGSLPPLLLAAIPFLVITRTWVSTILILPLPLTLAADNLNPRLDPYLNLLNGTFLALNNTWPNLTSSCWLCLTPSSYLSGYGQNLAPSNITILDPNHSNQDSNCNWMDTTIGVTVEVEGRGLCVGQSNLTNHGTYTALCTTNMTLDPSHSNSLLRPPNGTRWVCYYSGLQQCVSVAYLSTGQDFCVTVVIIPNVFYHPEDEIPTAPEHATHRQKRAAVGLTIAAILGATGAATGVGALVYQQVGLQPVLASMDSDIKRLEDSIKFLEQSHSSLAEVVLQNRRGLDLLFFKEGGLCAALGEECCFYVNHSGVICGNLAAIRKNLEKRQRERESNPWATLSSLRWFEFSPWLTSLIVTIRGILLVVLLLLIGGPPLVTLILNLLRRQVPLLLAQALPKDLQAQPPPAMIITQQPRTPGTPSR
uniref:Envelope glycoprotein n=1 Tax=Monodelphis domestica TaxID=13616 RepID=K7DZ33_MONDO